MRFEELQLQLMQLLKPYWKRVISLDFETRVINQRFLTDERILSICFAHRVSGNFMAANTIEIKTLFLDEDSDEAEIKLLERFNEEIGKIKPLGVLGYSLRHYDIPLLILKKQHYELKPVPWKLIDLTESAVHIDLYHLLKDKGFRNLEQAIMSQEYSHLPLKQTKDLVPQYREEKAREIDRLWREDREKLRQYGEGDVLDILLITEKLMLESH